MIYIENNCNDPGYNLALEEFVFKNIIEDDTILILWQNEPSVIIGKYQNTLEEINYEYIKENNVNVVRRDTGGGAVYHDLGNLNYSFIVPNVAQGIDFKTFTKPLVKALTSLGIPAVQTGRNDVTVDGCKFSGNAQQYHKGRLLHHGTIMFDVELDNVQKALHVKPGKIESKGIKSVRSRVTNLKPYFKNDMDTLGFKERLLNLFEEEYSISRYELPQEAQAQIKKLQEEKYSRWDWNYGKSPKSDVVKSAYFKCGYIEFHLQIEDHRIKSLQLIGDFFSSRDIDELTERFAGIKYDMDEFKAVCDSVNLGSYLGDITTEEVLNVIF